MHHHVLEKGLHMWCSRVSLAQVWTLLHSDVLLKGLGWLGGVGFVGQRLYLRHGSVRLLSWLGCACALLHVQKCGPYLKEEGQMLLHATDQLSVSCVPLGIEFAEPKSGASKLLHSFICSLICLVVASLVLSPGSPILDHGLCRMAFDLGDRDGFDILGLGMSVVHVPHVAIGLYGPRSFGSSALPYVLV